MKEDYNSPLSPWMFVDAMAAIEVAQRIGQSKLRHLETQSLWLQEAVRDKRIGLSNVHELVNPADLMTKHVDHAKQVRLLSLMSVEACMGRAETAPETGNVDEQVCYVESNAGETNEYECPDVDFEEELMDWFHECMDDRGAEAIAEGARDA